MTERPPYLVERNPGYFEYQLPISVKLVIDHHGRVPLLKNERDEWELPGGKLEVGETPEEGVCREAAEELGLAIAGVDIIDSWVYEITPIRHVFIVSFGAAYVGGEEPVYSDEHKELGLFSYDEVPGLHMPEPYKRTIHRWRERQLAGRAAASPALRDRRGSARGSGKLLSSTTASLDAGGAGDDDEGGVDGRIAEKAVPCAQLLDLVEPRTSPGS